VGIRAFLVFIDKTSPGRYSLGLYLYLDAAKHHYFDNETKVFLREMVLQNGEALKSETRINALAFSHNYSDYS